MAIRVVVFDIGGVLEIVDDDLWLDAWVARWDGLDGDSAAMEADFWDSYCGELNVQLRDFVVEISSDVRVAVLSNSAPGARQEEQRRYGFEDLFELMVYSDEVGLQKPDAEIYEYTQRLLGVAPGEILLLDDRVAAVHGAQAAGWNAFVHVETAASIAAIRRAIAVA